MNYENLKHITINDYIKSLLEPIFPDQLETMKQAYIEHGIYKEPNAEFDGFGLRYDIEFLNKVNTNVCFLPVQLMANFHDNVTKNFHKTFTIKNVGKFDITNYKNYNATSVGNVAYIYLNTNDNELRQRCYEWLTELIRYEIELSGLTAFFKEPQVIKPKFHA
jgi:hypothetical protein